MNKYFIFQQCLNFEGKTKKFEVFSKKRGYFLGKIYWYEGWKQYIFNVAFESAWRGECLKDIQEFLQELNEEKN